MTTLLETYNEGSTGYITITFYDGDDVLAAPDSFQYRIDCETTSVEIRDWTAVTTPGSEYRLTLTATDTAIQGAGNDTEQRRITISASYGSGDKLNDEVFFAVKNLKHIPVV